MAKNTLEILSESMFYVILALLREPRCGTEIADFVHKITKGRISIGPGTLYTILNKFAEENVIEEISIEGRKRTYQIKERGIQLYLQEKTRLHQMLDDAESEELS